jgi:hypothetical protein
MAHKKVQEVKLVVSIYTVAREPLTLGEHTLERLTEGFDKVVRNEVDLRYYPDSKYVEEYHDYTGVSITEVI